MKDATQDVTHAANTPSRRKFMAGATAATGAALGFPAIVRAQSPIVFRFQSTWPANDIFHEFALDYARKVNEIADGELRIEVLPAGAVVRAFDLLDAVSAGTLDGGHGVVAYWYGKNTAVALWGSGPAFGMDANMVLAWHEYGGGKELLTEIQAAMGVNVVSLMYGPYPTQPLGWFKRPIARVEDMKGVKFRTVGLAIDIYAGMGAAVNALPGGEIVPAMDRGLLDGAEFNNASSDLALGFADVSKVCMLQSFHQSAEQFEILFNKNRYEALSPRLKHVLTYAAQAASADMSWKAIDRYSRDYDVLRNERGVNFYKTPDAILQRQLEIWDQIIERRSAENPLFKKVLDSQRAFAERVGRWHGDTNINYGMAYNHYFRKKS